MAGERIDQPVGSAAAAVAYDPQAISPLSVTRLVEAAVETLAAADALADAGAKGAFTPVARAIIALSLAPPADRLRAQLAAIGALAGGRSQ